MNTEFGELAQGRYRSRMRKRKRNTIIGTLVLVFGYWLMGVSPSTSGTWVLVRVAAGVVCIVVGFGLAIQPWLSNKGDDE